MAIPALQPSTWPPFLALNYIIDQPLFSMARQKRIWGAAAKMAIRGRSDTLEARLQGIFQACGAPVSHNLEAGRGKQPEG